MDRIHTPAAPPMGYADLAMAHHNTHCAPCRTLTEESDAREAANGESIRRRDRRTLGLHHPTDSDPDMDEALRRVLAGRPAVTA
ncbi:hypothetical protein ABZ172_04955 [Streptomyces sp. NPDC006296]|uniref:hypothetical protein n=1 Tax=Streptomyces sp. NPDC006296 TaxID=3156746 RepID=UPI0033BA20CC